MKCYICLTDSIVNRKDYFNMLKVTLISARKNTSLRLICLYDGKIGDPVYNLLKDFKVEIIIHELPYKKELMEIYSHEWMETELGKDIEYSRIFGTFMRMEIPIIEKEDEYVLYTDMDIIFNDDILLKDLPHPAYLAAAPEFERDTKRMSYFNAGILVMNIQGMYNPQIQISAESETKRSIFREKDKTKRSKKESAQHSKSRNKSFVMTSVSAL